MTLFLIAGIGLAVVVLAYVMAPLWRGGRTVAAALVLACTGVVGLLYSVVGTPEALDPTVRNPPATLDDAITRLEQQLAREPGQAEGWRLLARAYAAAGRAPAARDAYARAVKLQPDPDVLAEAAESRALADPARRFDSEAVAYLQQALRLQPAHQRARWFLGISHRQAGRPAEAARTWEPLLAQVDARTAASLRPQIDAAREAAGLAPLPVAKEVGLTVTVDLDPALKGMLPPGAALFVLAKQPDGPPMPVAVERVPARFPATVVLSDADSPMPTLRLSQLNKVRISARISLKGDATPRPGDLESIPQDVDPKRQEPVTLRIDAGAR